MRRHLRRRRKLRKHLVREQKAANGTSSSFLETGATAATALSATSIMHRMDQMISGKLDALGQMRAAEQEADKLTESWSESPAGSVGAARDEKLMDSYEQLYKASKSRSARDSAVSLGSSLLELEKKSNTAAKDTLPADRHEQKREKDALANDERLASERFGEAREVHLAEIDKRLAAERDAEKRQKDSR